MKKSNFEKLDKRIDELQTKNQESMVQKQKKIQMVSADSLDKMTPKSSHVENLKKQNKTNSTSKVP